MRSVPRAARADLEVTGQARHELLVELAVDVHQHHPSGDVAAVGVGVVGTALDHRLSDPADRWLFSRFDAVLDALPTPVT